MAILEHIIFMPDKVHTVGMEDSMLDMDMEAIINTMDMVDMPQLIIVEDINKTTSLGNLDNMEHFMALEISKVFTRDLH